MSTLNQIVYRILGKLEVNSTDDSNTDLREIESEVHKKRALYLRQELNKNRSIDENVKQDLGCIELEVVDRAQCCDIEVDCSILRTAVDIPKAIELNFGNPLWVGPVDKLEYPFSFVTLEQARWAGNGRFNSKAIFAFPLNRRIYLISKDDSHKFMTHINVRGVFEDPTAAGVFTNCTTGSSCYTKDTEYPVNEWMLNLIEQEVYNEFLPKLKNPVDTNNDAKDDKMQQGMAK